MTEVFQFRPYRADDPLTSLYDGYYPHKGDDRDPVWAARLAESYREDVDKVRPMLLGELALADAQYTGRNVACVLSTDWNRHYAGHTDEPAADSIVSAYAMAYEKIPPEDTKALSVIYVAGRDLKKDKHVMPSPVDYDVLSKRFQCWGPPILIVQADPLAGYKTVWADAHGPTYGAKEASDFYDLYSEDDDVFAYYIEQETGLNSADAMFMVHLHHTGFAEEVTFYLTGSASGRGVPSNAVKDGYEDLDVIAISERDEEEVEALFRSAAADHYGVTLSKEEKEVVLWPSGSVVRGMYLRSDRITFDFFVGRRLEDVIVRPDNIERNFLHKVS